MPSSEIQKVWGVSRVCISCKLAEGDADVAGSALKKHLPREPWGAREHDGSGGGPQQPSKKCQRGHTPPHSAWDSPEDTGQPGSSQAPLVIHWGMVPFS